MWTRGKLAPASIHRASSYNEYVLIILVIG